MDPKAVLQEAYDSPHPSSMYEQKYSEDSADDAHLLGDPTTPRHRRRRLPYLWPAIALLVTHLATALLTLHFSTLHCNSGIRDVLPSSLAMIKGVDFSFHRTRFELPFWDLNVYREKPSVAVDQAWADLGVNYGVFWLPESIATMDGIGLSPETHVHKRLNTTDEPVYPVLVEGTHQLHCVDLLRQALYFNVDYYRKHSPSFTDSEAALRLHITHCVDVLRQRIMCTADPGMMGWRLKPGTDPKTGEQRSAPDFSTVHMCRDWHSLRRWAKEMQVDKNGM